MNRWPLLTIGASAGVATWSGWVGLGERTGFGVVQPLPGIIDLHINTAVTLPIGVEAYAIYALSVATSEHLQPRTRRYAWASAALALGLGMAGQIAYHLMAALPPGRLAPGWVIALVSCLPVLVLGGASLLWHLVSADSIGSTPIATLSIESDPIETPIDSIEPAIESDRIESIESDPIESPVESIGPDPISPIRSSPRSSPIRSARSIDDLRAEFDRMVKDGQLRADDSMESIRIALRCSPDRARIAAGRKAA